MKGRLLHLNGEGRGGYQQNKVVTPSLASLGTLLPPAHPESKTAHTEVAAELLQQLAPG